MRKILVVISFLLLFETVLHAATFVVVNTNDTGGGSLRLAMTTANSNPGPDTILFNIPGPGVHTIMPQSQLPLLTDNNGVIIDGLSQPGSSMGSSPPLSLVLMIELKGTQAGASHGIWITSSYDTIQGLIINEFQQDGIRIQANPGWPIGYNLISCCFIGTDSLGQVPLGNGTNQAQLWAGVDIVVTPAEPGVVFDNRVLWCLVSDNYAEGIGISSCPPGDNYANIVQSNFIGTDVTGTLDFGNLHTGVYIGEGAHDNQVAGNYISGNDWDGVSIVGYAEAMPPVSTDNNHVNGNLIGLDIIMGPLPNGHHGINIGAYGTMYYGGYAMNNDANSNYIAYNGAGGISVWEHHQTNNNCDCSRFVTNAIYSNQGLGIDLGDNGVTPNDAGDPDTGPNEELNFPVILGAAYAGGLTTVWGTLDNASPATSVVEIFMAQPDPSGYGEGMAYLGSANPDASGNWSTTVSGAAIGDTLTATATDTYNNTSEFCYNYGAVGISENDAGNLPGHCDVTPTITRDAVLVRMHGGQRITAATIAVYDAAGTRMTTQTVSGREMQLSLLNFAPGVYFVRIGDATAKVLLLK